MAQQYKCGCFPPLRPGEATHRALREIRRSGFLPGPPVMVLFSDGLDRVKVTSFPGLGLGNWGTPSDHFRTSEISPLI